MSSGTYYIKLYFINPYLTGTISTFIHKTHQHSYTSSYAWKNYSQHKAFCSCNSSKLEGHAIEAGSLSGGSLPLCIKCNGPVQTGFVGPDFLLNNNQLLTTYNGSYVLPNGVIVLNELDIEAYLNDSLVFNNNISMLYSSNSNSNDKIVTLSYLKKKIFEGENKNEK